MQYAICSHIHEKYTIILIYIGLYRRYRTYLLLLCVQLSFIIYIFQEQDLKYKHSEEKGRGQLSNKKTFVFSFSRFWGEKNYFCSSSRST